MDSVLLSSEIDIFIDTMQPQSMTDIGSRTWLDWHQRLQKLSQQAVLEASSMKEEYVKETLVDLGKVPVLVHEAIVINLWKYKMLPLLLRIEPEPQNTFIAYSILYHEAVAVSLLELVMFHAGASESLGDIAPDLLDYACGASSQLLVVKKLEPNSAEPAKLELIRHRDNLSFDIGLRCLTILRYLAEYLDRLPLGVAERMFNVNDIPVLLIEILLERPWVDVNKLYKGGRWVAWDGEALGPSEAQVWLGLRQLLLDPVGAARYSITDSRRSQLLKLQPLMSLTLLDQLSPLIELKHWLCKLAVTEQPAVANKAVLLETVLEIKQSILAECHGKWKKLARQQVGVVFCRDLNQLQETAQSLSEAYNTELLEKCEPKESENFCEKCNKRAIQRCSRCKHVWYCSRQCQVEDWTEHKPNCPEKE